MFGGATLRDSLPDLQIVHFCAPPRMFFAQQALGSDLRSDIRPVGVFVDKFRTLSTCDTWPLFYSQSNCVMVTVTPRI